MTESADPQTDVLDHEAAPVRGTVRLMTEEPIPEEELERGGVWAVSCRAIAANSWLVPASLLGLTALVLLLRRRRP